jgi:MFS family permease
MNQHPWRSPLVLLLAAVLFLNYVDRGAVPTAAYSIQADLHLTARQLGVLSSAFFLTYTLMQIPVGWLAERFGAHRVLAVGLSLWAVATLSTGVASGYLMLLLLRLVLGVGESAGFPCTSKILAAAVPSRNLGSANGVIAFAYLLGPAAGIFIGGLLMAHLGWRAMFFVLGGISLLWLWPWSRIGFQQVAAPAATVSSVTFGKILRQRGLWGAGLGHFASNYMYYFMLSWLPYYLQKERGFSATSMSWVVSSAYLVNGIAAFAAGWAIDRYIARGGSATFGYKLLMGVSNIGAVASMFCVAVSPQPVAIACIFFYQALCGAQSPGVFAVPQILAGPSATGRWVGIQNTLGNLSGIIAPWLTGQIFERTGHFAAAFICAAAVGILGFVGWVLIVPRIDQLSWDDQTAGRSSIESTLLG